ncbi:MAG: A/G-specific adenine glycosylase [Chthonomonas sp.]|nr:A/G-specific adenine glycosylase [Chthonomonas sp.]
MTDDLKAALRDWYAAHHRDLPWRKTRDPYAIWVSEVMSQQTRIEVVIGFWERWMAAFPTIAALAEAEESDVLALWQGLGYYRRAKMLLAGARAVHLNGLPNSAAEWRAVPGVGAYTAGAIASIALHERVPAVDGNVHRVYSRFTADGEQRGFTKRAETWAQEVIPPDRPGDWNQAVMELGARVCTPRSPKCPGCPLRPGCAAANAGNPEEYPPSKRAAPPQVRHQVIYLAEQRGRFLVRPVPPGTWWQGLWSLPFEFVDAPLDAPVWWAGSYVVTKHRIEFQVVQQCPSDETGEWLTPAEIRQLALPAIHQKILARCADRVRKVAEQPALEVGYL